MTDDVYDDDTTDDEEPQPKPSRNWRRLEEAKERAEKERDEARQQLAAAEDTKRQLVFLKAGIDPDDPKNKYLVKGYEGELEVDAIRSEAIEAGLLAPPEPEPALQEAAAAAQVAAGGLPPQGTAESEAEKQAALDALGPKATPYKVAEVLRRFDGDTAVTNDG